jgi:FMN reductase
MTDSTTTPPDVTTDRPRQIVIINAGTSEPSSSRMVADRIAQKTIDQLTAEGVATTARVTELGPLAGEIAHAIVSGIPEGRLLEVVQSLAAADGLIVTTPIYKAGISGLLKSFIDILDNDLLIATPVVLAASAGSARHALVIDDQMRPLLAFMRTLTAPTSVFAAPEDWADPALTRRVERAAAELAALVSSGVSDMITGRVWASYQHTFGGNARPGEGVAEIDFDSDMMRLATGISTPAGAA